MYNILSNFKKSQTKHPKLMKDIFCWVSIDYR